MRKRANESKHPTVESRQITKGKKKRARKKETQEVQKPARKEGGGDKSLPINNYVKYKGLTSSVKRDRVLNGLNNKPKQARLGAHKRLTSASRARVGGK